MKKMFIIAILVACLLASCSGVPADNADPTPTTPGQATLGGLGIESYPAVDGSTSALPLQQMIACHVFELTCDWSETFLFDETRSILPAMDDPGPEEALEFLFNISHEGTHDSYMNLIRDKADFILVARPPSQDELNASRLRGVKLDYRPVALDAFVFLVNQANPVKSMEVDLIREIYTGNIISWDQLGVDLDYEGNNAITTYQRNQNSGSQELMESLVMQGVEMIDSPDLLLYGMMGPFNAIGGDVLGIGYSVYFYATFMLPTETVRLAPVQGVLPTYETIADGSYPFVTEVYVVVREDASPESPAVQLRNWLLTAEGQAVVAASGYVPAAGGQE